MPKRWDTETKEKAIRLVIEHQSDYSSEWAAITTIATRLGMSAETLRKWVRQSRVDAGQVEGVTTEQADEIRELKRNNAERAGADRCHSEGSDDFLRAGERPATSVICTFITEHRASLGVAPIWGVWAVSSRQRNDL